MTDSEKSVPKWTYWILASIVAALVYCGYIHAMPGYIMIFMLVCLLAYAGVGSYFLYRQGNTKAIVGVWIAVIVTVGIFAFNAVAINKLLGIE